MPKLVRLYIRHVLIGWAIAALFCAGLIALDVAGLRHLVLHTRGGWMAGLMLFISSGVVFAGVQFAIVIMGMAESDDKPRGGLRQPLRRAAPVPVEAGAERRSGAQPHPRAAR